MRVIFLIGFSLFIQLSVANAQYWQKDTLKTSKGDVLVEVVGHCFLHFTYNRLHIYVDPIQNVTDLARLPKADLILITHDHRDHFNTNAIEFLSKPETTVIIPKSCISKVKNGQLLGNGMQITFKDIYIKAVAAYNVKHLRPDNVPYHPKGDGNGYFLVIGNKTIYISGDTENVDEVRGFMKPDLAYITTMMPFTMDEKMCIDIVRRLKPPLLYLLHQNINKDSLVNQLKTVVPGITIRLPY